MMMAKRYHLKCRKDFFCMQWGMKAWANLAVQTHSSGRKCHRNILNFNFMSFHIKLHFYGNMKEDPLPWNGDDWYFVIGNNRASPLATYCSPRTNLKPWKQRIELKFHGSSILNWLQITTSSQTGCQLIIFFGGVNSIFSRSYHMTINMYHFSNKVFSFSCTTHNNVFAKKKIHSRIFETSRGMA